MRRWAVRVVLPVALATVAADGQSRAEEGAERYLVRAELGAEYDSNVHRTERVQNMPDPPPLVGSALGRGVLTGSFADTIGTRQAVTMSATIGGKLFAAPAARNEDVAVAQSEVGWSLRLGGRTTLSAGGVYYEAFQRGGSPDPAEQRDFRSLTPSLRLGVALGSETEVGVGAGYRVFVFKPDRDFDFTAPVASADLRWAHESADGSSDWEGTAGTSFERRAFAGPALDKICTTDATGVQSCVLTPRDDLHVDDFLLARVDLARTGRVLVGGGYTFQYNLSNSYGSTVLRHFVSARFAAALPFQMYLAARGDLLIASYPKGTIVGQVSAMGVPYASIEDGENQSTARVDLSRNLTAHTQLIARYTIYTPALGSAVRYNRQTALLSLAFTIE
jgi:hypothetical protein